MDIEKLRKKSQEIFTMDFIESTLNFKKQTTFSLRMSLYLNLSRLQRETDRNQEAKWNKDF